MLYRDVLIVRRWGLCLRCAEDVSMMHFVYGCTEVNALIANGRIIVFHLFL
jgi:hypothetical protein